MAAGETTPPTEGSGGSPAASAITSCPMAAAAVPVTVEIKLSQPVACPGHPLLITAVGKPAGGTYEWVVFDAELVNGAGHPVSKGHAVNLRYFHSDDGDGSIPEHEANVAVTYTHPKGTAVDAKTVTVHKIDFTITNDTVQRGLTQVIESAHNVAIGALIPQTMTSDPQVQINLDDSCPRKTECAKNHRVGWLQSVISVDRRARYTHTQIEVTKTQPFPLRDGDPFAGPSPFPFYDKAFTFNGDGDTQTAHHFDNPSQLGRPGAAYKDPRHGAPAPPPPENQQLRQLFFQIGFHAWLVVQNKEWSKHDLEGAFAYQRNFDWDTHLDVEVDTTQPVGVRCTPQIEAAFTAPIMSSGKGSNSPSLMKKCSNELNKVTTTAEPAL